MTSQGTGPADRGGSRGDRYVHPAEGDDPRDIDRERTDEETVAKNQRDRAVTHPQETERQQGTSADRPGIDPSDRERVDDLPDE